MNTRTTPNSSTPSKSGVGSLKSIIVLGIDIGTSGVRGCIVEKTVPRHSTKNSPHPPALEDEKVLYTNSVSLAPPLLNAPLKSATQNSAFWIEAVHQLLVKITKNFDLNCVNHLVVDATSSTVLLCDSENSALSNASMYHDQQAIQEAEWISGFPGFNSMSGAVGASSSLAKALFLSKTVAAKRQTDPTPVFLCHQIDCVNFFLSGQAAITDENSALKTGYDSIIQAWPDWVQRLLLQHSLLFKTAPIKLPKVVPPGLPIGRLCPEIIERYGFSKAAVLHAGTTDSIAGFLASGAHKVGDAVISLGSTLAIKVISDVPIFSSELGIYSHRLNNVWLVGGASNSGGALLTDTYSLAEITALIKAIQRNKRRLAIVEQNAYYPLKKPGERFPIADPNLAPRMPVKPDQKIECASPSLAHQDYFLGVVHGLICVEQLAYATLQELGCPAIQQIYTVGGGVQNSLWMSLRAERLLSRGRDLNNGAIPKLRLATSTEAAFGVTRLVSRSTTVTP